MKQLLAEISSGETKLNVFPSFIIIMILLNNVKTYNSPNLWERDLLLFVFRSVAMSAVYTRGDTIYETYVFTIIYSTQSNNSVIGRELSRKNITHKMY